MKILVTGANGFIGSNLCFALRRRADTELNLVDVQTTPEDIQRGLQQAEIIFHLAGVNRPKVEAEYYVVNAQFTESMCERLLTLDRAPENHLCIINTGRIR